MSITGNNFASFGEFFHVFRKQAKLPQHQLAIAVGMHRHEIVCWEQVSVLPARKTIVLELARQLHLNDSETRQLLEAIKHPDA